MKSLKHISLAITMLCCFLSFSQEKTITGTVSDENEVLPFVVVQIKGTKTVTHTDFDGKFSIKAKVGDTLLFSFIGYDSIKVKIKKRTNTLNIVLISNTTVSYTHLDVYKRQAVSHLKKVFKKGRRN